MSPMKKEEIKDGLSALFGEGQISSPAAPQSPEPQEADILDTLTDEEIREAAMAYRQRKVGRPKKLFGDRATENYERITTIANKEKMAKLRYIASKENLTMKDIFEEMMNECIAAYESKFGIIPTNREDNRKGSAKGLFNRS